MPDFRFQSDLLNTAAFRPLAPRDFLLIIFCTVCWSPLLTAQDKASIQQSSDRTQIEEVVEGLNLWTQSFHSIRIETRHSNRFRSGRRINLRGPQLPEVDPEKAVFVTTLWYENRFRFFSQSDLYEEDRLITRRARAVDGFRFWIADSSPEDPLQFESITLMPLQPVASPNINFTSAHPLQNQAVSRALEGIWQNSECCWMSDYLQRHEKVHWLGNENVDGHHCIKLRITPAHLIEASRQRNSIWWFDSAHGYLPIRKISYEGAAAADKLAEREKDIWVALEFAELEGRFWFPKRGVMRYDRFDPATESIRSFEEPWEVSGVTLNERVPAAILKVPLATALTKSYVNNFEMTTPDSAADSAAVSAASAPPSDKPIHRNGFWSTPGFLLPLFALPVAAIFARLVVRRIRRRTMASS